MPRKDGFIIMKKLTSVILALVMLLSLASLTGCEKSSYEVFFDAMEKTNSLDSYSATMNMDISMKMMGMTVKVPMVYDMKVAGVQSEKPEILADVTASVLGTEMVMSLYSDAEYAYISSADIGNMKTKLGGISGGEYDIMDDVNDIMVVLPEEVFADIVFVENSDGIKTASFTISEELFNEYYSDIITSVAEQSAGSGVDVEISISNILITVGINKAGYIANYDMEFSMEFSMDVMGTVVDVTADTVTGMKFHNPGEAVTVTPPEGIEAYPEV